MTYQEFVSKYNGQKIDYDGYYGSQCWDLAQFYITEVLGLPSSIISGCGVVKNLVHAPKLSEMLKYFDEVRTDNMKQGDICIWDFGDAGHIAIFDHFDSNSNQCYYFSQNPNACKIMPFNANGHHAFRLKGSDLPSITSTVARDESKNQIEVKVDKLNVRQDNNTKAQSLGFAPKGIYNVLDESTNDNYKWYKIANKQFVAFKEEWITYLPKKENAEEQLKKEINELKAQLDDADKELNKYKTIVEKVKELVKD